jgi:glycosyltransferase involved in cell wall biosynthesis
VTGDDYKDTLMAPKPDVIIIEPYYGGSHRAFINGLQTHLDLEFTLLRLPARKWKMRMQLAAPWAGDKIISLVNTGSRYDGILCSTFIDVAVLRSLLSRAGLYLPVAIYFHENQFSYPGQVTDPGYHQFTAINFTSALTADFLAFNSHYNLDTFISGIRHYLNKAPDMKLQYLVGIVAEKAVVLYPGVDFSCIDKVLPSRQLNKVPVIVWNHRWEHDKDPHRFFSSLVELSEKGIPFQLIVLGQHFQHCPDISSWAKEKLKKHIIHFGFVESRTTYARLLARGDIVVSTALHEFFGMSILEGVRAGCRPLVPDRLAYTELFPRQYRYQKGQFIRQLGQLLEHSIPISKKESRQLTERFSWPVVAGRYEKWLKKVVRGNLAV